MLLEAMEIIKLILGEGPNAMEAVKKLRGKDRKQLFRSLVWLYESIDRLEDNASKLLTEVDYFETWIKTGASHTLENYVSSVRAIYYDSFKILNELLDSWQRNKTSISSYIKIRDPDLHQALRSIFWVKGQFIYLVAQSVKEYSKHGIKFTEDLESFRKASNALRDKGVKEIPYIDSMKFLLESRPGIIPESPAMDIQVKFCSVNSIKDLAEYRNHLVAIKTSYSGTKKLLRKILTVHFIIEDMF